MCACTYHSTFNNISLIHDRDMFDAPQAGLFSHAVNRLVFLLALCIE